MAQTPWALPDGFDEEVKRAIRQLFASFKNARKAIPPEALELLRMGDWRGFQELMDWHGYELQFESFKDIIAAQAKSQAVAFWETGGIGAKLSFDLIDERAVFYASTRTAELVKDITDDMRASIVRSVTSSTMGDMTWQQAAEEIYDILPLTTRDAEAVRKYRERQFDRFVKKGMSIKDATARANERRAAYAEKLMRSRANTIARTEIASAASQGRYLGWEESVSSGMVDAASLKEWIAEPDACPICGEMDGKTVKWDESFREGIDMPPAHPNCRCAAALLPPDYADTVFTAQALQKSASNQFEIEFAKHLEGLAEITKAIEDDSFKPTQGMVAAAKRALRWKMNGIARGAGTPVGWGRATDIAAGRSMSLSVVTRTYSFFARHEVDKKGKDFDNTSNPSNGRIMWDAWGGDAGFTWSKAIVERAKRVEKHLSGKHDQSSHAGGRASVSEPVDSGKRKTKYDLTSYGKAVKDPAVLAKARQIVVENAQTTVDKDDLDLAEQKLGFRSMPMPDDNFESYFVEADDAVKELIAQPNSISVFVPEEALDYIIKDGRLITHFEDVDSKGSTYYAERALYEKVAFDYDETNIEPKDRPISGAVMPVGNKFADEFGENYGTVRIILKDDVKQRATFTLGDSLDQWQQPFDANGKLPRTMDILNTANSISRYKRNNGGNILLDPKWHGGNYVEAQIHGGIKVSDIEKIILRYPTYDSSAIDLAASGIPFEIDEGNN